MKLTTSIVVLAALIAGRSIFAQEESPAASPAEEKTAAPNVETAPSAPMETPAPTPETKASPASTAAATKTATSATTASASPSKSAAPAKATTVEGKLKEMENQWAEAFKKHDAAAIEPMVAEDFIGVNPQGKVQNRHGLLAEAKSTKETYTTEKNEKLEVKRYGNNVAVVVGTSREQGTDKSGKKFDRKYRFVDTWIDRGGKWQCVASAVSLLK